MFTFLRKRHVERERAASEADHLIALFGGPGYEVARRHRRRTLGYVQHAFWCEVARIIADRTHRNVGLDTATRYIDDHPSRSAHAPEIE
jgi:hypothetical protein